MFCSSERYVYCYVLRAMLHGNPDRRISPDRLKLGEGPSLLFKSEADASIVVDRIKSHVVLQNFATGEESKIYLLQAEGTETHDFKLHHDQP